MSRFFFRFIRAVYKQYNSIVDLITTAIMRMLIKLMCPTSTIGKNFVSKGLFTIRAKRSSTISIGDNVMFRNRRQDNMLGLNKRSTIEVFENAYLKIGNNTGFSNISIVCATQINIGEHCNFGGNVFMWDTDFHEIDYLERRNYTGNIKTAPITIGDDVFIGANSIILKGVSIGDRSVVGAGSVVTKAIPADEIWAGNPAKFIRHLANNK
jgi:acetyltransferase-like isoleucine patch superfamily enzyme